MISVEYGGRFLKEAAELPKEIQTKLARLVPLLQENPYHPSLHTKRLSAPLAGLLSFRITRDWRVIFQFSSPTAI